MFILKHPARIPYFSKIKGKVSEARVELTKQLQQLSRGWLYFGHLSEAWRAKTTKILATILYNYQRSDIIIIMHTRQDQETFCKLDVEVLCDLSSDTKL